MPWVKIRLPQIPCSRTRLKSAGALPIGHSRLVFCPLFGIMRPQKSQLFLGDLPVGCRLLVRSRIDWRFAAIARKNVDSIVLSVASPKGRNYRLARPLDSCLIFDGKIPYLPADESEIWRENFSRYDLRW